MFSDNEAFFDKFRTCARVRAKENQKLGQNFYTKESSKPIFKKIILLTVKNPYQQRCIMKIFKIIKFKVPVSMISLVREFERKECQLITPFPSHIFTYQSAWLWNKFKSVNRSINFSLTSIKIKNIQKLYARYLCSRDALGQARRATIRYLVYEY